MTFPPLKRVARPRNGSRWQSAPRSIPLASVDLALLLLIEGLGVEGAGWHGDAGEGRENHHDGYDRLHSYISLTTEIRTKLIAARDRRLLIGWENLSRCVLHH